MVINYDTRTDTDDNITIQSASAGTVRVTMSDDALNKSGMGMGQVSIIDSSGTKVTSQAFYIYIREGWDAGSSNESPP